MCEDHAEAEKHRRVPDEAKQGAETLHAGNNRTGVEAERWTERMLSALATAS